MGAEYPGLFRHLDPHVLHTAAVFAMDGVDISDPEMGGATFTLDRGTAST